MHCDYNTVIIVTNFTYILSLEVDISILCST